MVSAMLRRPNREQSLADRILHLLRLYSSNWTGTVGRGDVVIPQREMAHLVRDLLSLFKQAQELPGEASEAEVFQTLMESQRLSSVQDRVSALRKRFLIIERPTGSG